jgi:hypothetical protein
LIFFHLKLLPLIKPQSETFSLPNRIECWERPSALAGINHRLFCRSTVGSFANQPSALSPVTESTIERTNTCLVGPAGTQKPHRNTQFTRTSTRRKMNNVLDGDEHRGAYALISWLYFTGLVNIQRRSTGATYRMGSCPPRRPVRYDLQDSLSPA